MGLLDAEIIHNTQAIYKSDRVCIQHSKHSNHRHGSISFVAFRACCQHKICIHALYCIYDC